MSEIGAVSRVLQSILDRFVPRLPSYPALLGDGANEDVTVDGWPGWVWARVGSDETLERVYNNRVPNRADLPVIVGYDFIQPTLFQVLSIRETYAGAGTGQGRVPQVVGHHEMHEWPTVGDDDSDGSDIAYISQRQVRGCRVSTSSLGAFYVECETGAYRTAAGWAWATAQNLDLTSLKPSNSARWALVYLDSSGTIAARAGSIVGLTSISVSDIPDIQESEFALAGVLLWASQTALQDDADRQDILDLRWLQAGRAPHEIISDTHTDTGGSPAVGDVLTYTDADEWAPRPPSGGDGGGGDTEPAIGPHWHADGPLAVADEVDGVWRLTSDWRIEYVHLYVETLGSTSSTIIDVEKSTTNGNSWTSIFPSGAPEIAYDNADHVVSAAPPGLQILASGTLLRMNIDQVATGARGISVEVDGYYQGQSGLETNLMPIMGVG